MWKISLNNLICHKLGILSFLLTNYCHLLSDNVGEGMFLWVVALVERISIPFRTRVTFLLSSFGTNIIIMPL